jgi:transcriptional regulator with XRE-family HTH domain
MEALAESAGISTSYLSEVERGLKRPSTDVIAKIAEALEMRASEFLERVESSSPIRSRFAARMESPRLRARFSARLPADEAVLYDMRAPTSKEDLIRALLNASESLNEEDIQTLLKLATRLGQARDPGSSQE